MKEYPESEIQAKFFADAGEKRSEILAKNFADFYPLPFNFQEKWPQEISQKILHIFHKGRNKILSPRDSGRGVPQVYDLCHGQSLLLLLLLVNDVLVSLLVFSLGFPFWSILKGFSGFGRRENPWYLFFSWYLRQNQSTEEQQLLNNC